MQVLRVVATDSDGNQQEASINVEFSNELLIEVTSPVLDGGEFPEISRPFDWEVTASSPAGITGVSFLVDGVEIATDREGPVYSARIDPLLYNGMPSDLCGDEFEHNLSIVVTDGNGEQFTGAWCAAWDSTPPLIRLTNPAVELDGSAGLITRSADGTRFNIEMELEDNDDQPSVAVEVNDAVVGQQDTPPYQVGLEAAPLLENVDTHDQEVTLLVRASDYLGNESTVAPDVRVTRAIGPSL